MAPTIIVLRVVRQLPQTEVDGTQRQTQLTFRRSCLGTGTSGIGTLLSICSEIISREEMENFSTAHSHLTEHHEQTSITQGNKMESRSGEDLTKNEEAVWTVDFAALHYIYWWKLSLNRCSQPWLHWIIFTHSTLSSRPLNDCSYTICATAQMELLCGANVMVDWYFLMLTCSAQWTHISGQCLCRIDSVCWYTEK